jgi:hypothetical protein
MKKNAMRIKVIIVMFFVSAFGVVRAQKGDISISGGPLLSFASYNYGQSHHNAVGAGVEVKGQYNFSKRSAIVLQAHSAFYGLKKGADSAARHHRTILSAAAGYRYQFAASGFFANILIGVDKYSDHESNSAYFGLDAAEVPTAIVIGIGKRFAVTDNYFIEAGIDFISNSYQETRVNLKATCSLF